jgi:hypothetical protein
MKFLLEYSQFNDDINSFHLSKELIDEIKEVLTDYLEDVVEEKLPKIEEGRILPNFELNRLYAQPSRSDRTFSTQIPNNTIFINKQDYPIQLEHLSQIIKNIDESLVCLSTHNTSILICKKRIIDMFEAYQKLPNALENVIAEIVDGYGRWQRWKTAFIIDFEGAKMTGSSFTIQKDYPGALGSAYYPKLEVKFYIPDISQWEYFDEITLDMYFEIQKPVRSISGTSNKYNTDKELEDIKSKLESSNEVFIYDINDSQKQIEDDLSDWIESEILVHFENDFSKKFDRFKTILKDIKEIELDYDEDYEFDIESTFEVIVKYKGLELILNFLYDLKTDKIKIFDEFDKLLDECLLEDLQEYLFLIMIEKR